MRHNNIKYSDLQHHNTGLKNISKHLLKERGIECRFYNIRCHCAGYNYPFFNDSASLLRMF